MTRSRMIAITLASGALLVFGYLAAFVGLMWLVLQ